MPETADLELERKYFDEDHWEDVSLEEAKQILLRAYVYWDPAERSLREGNLIATFAAWYRMKRKDDQDESRKEQPNE